MTETIRERLACYAHDAWSGIMRSVFRKGEMRLRGDFIMPIEEVQRRKELAHTPYQDLPVMEQSSDLVEADKIIEIVTPYFQEKIDKLKEELARLEEMILEEDGFHLCEECLEVQREDDMTEAGNSGEWRCTKRCHENYLEETKGRGYGCPGCEGGVPANCTCRGR